MFAGALHHYVGEYHIFHLCTIAHKYAKTSICVGHHTIVEGDVAEIAVAFRPEFESCGGGHDGAVCDHDIATALLDRCLLCAL